MKELIDIHADRFYSDLVKNAVLIEERVEGTNENGDLRTFYGFDDAFDEADYESFVLDEYGTAFYYFNHKIFMVSIFLENNEAIGINEFEEEEVKEFIAELINSDPYFGDKATFLAENNWAISHVD